MRVKLTLLIAALIILGSFSSAYAAEDVVTLEQARKLAKEHSRSMTRQEINTQKAKYQMYNIDDQYSNAHYESASLMNRYNRLSAEYAALLAQADGDDESVVSRLNEIEAEMNNIWQSIERQADLLDSVSSKKTSAEDNYQDSIKAEENYQQRLAYTVEELYTTILVRENNLLTLNKELDLKLSLLNIEKARLQLGRTSQLKVDQLSLEYTKLQREVVEQNLPINNLKGKLNDLMGKKYASDLKLAHFEILAKVELADCDNLLAKATREYNTISGLQRDISKMKDDLGNSKYSYYENDILKLEIKDKEIQLEDEKYKLLETINSLITNAESRQEEYQMSLINYDNEKKSYTRDQKRFDLGQLSKLDLAQSELSYLKMKDKIVSSGYNLYLANQALKLAEAGVL